MIVVAVVALAAMALQEVVTSDDGATVVAHRARHDRRAGRHGHVGDRRRR